MLTSANKQKGKAPSRKNHESKIMVGTLPIIETHTFAPYRLSLPAGTPPHLTAECIDAGFRVGSFSETGGSKPCHQHTVL